MLVVTVLLPVIIGLAVKLVSPPVTRVVQQDATDAAGQAVFVPTGVSHSHQEAVVDLEATALASLAHLVAPLTATPWTTRSKVIKYLFN